MALLQPILPFLRPLGPPRSSTYRHLLRFSTASRLRVDQSVTSDSSAPTSPPAAPSSQPSPLPETPKEASRAADLAATEALIEADSAQPPVSKPVPSSKSPRSTKHVKKSKPAKSATMTPKLPKDPKLPAPPAYHVARSHNNNYPVYTDYKRGGNLHLTTVRKVTGNLAALRAELRTLLEKDKYEVKINDLTKHVIVKGHHAPQIMDYLKLRGF
ncbi:hypothetical protein K469DRAFT_705238 [Zopfia rhizophila CBS 207.26]|uniref:Large ribosomal subunit protein mL49 n=1 Tax=Zopfia rhizophila CBS 207.26 TaxID=1314779 RepID=A0A6A6D5H9_9PEZI|nr:hypothetical protein K469DRAFT_705238 [Zopfia rhizophila CBS 207.26]